MFKSHLDAKRVSAKIVKAYLTGLRSAHIDMRFEDDFKVFHSPSLQRVIC